MVEPNTVIIGASVAPWIYKAGCMFLDWLQKPRSQRRKLVLLLPQKALKSTICKRLTSSNPNVRLYDLDEVVLARASAEDVVKLKLAEHCDNNASELLRYKYVQSAIDEIKATWLKDRNHRAIFVTSDASVVASIFKPTSIGVAMPSEQFHQQLIQKLSPEEQTVANRSHAQFRDLFYRTDDPCSVYDSLQDLANIIIAHYGLNYRP